MIEKQGQELIWLRSTSEKWDGLERKDDKDVEVDKCELDGEFEMNSRVFGVS